MTLFSCTLILLLIIDPLGNIASFQKILENHPLKKRRTLIAKELLIALFAMMVFNLIGEKLFQILELSDISLRLSSGTILFIAAIKILFPTEEYRGLNFNQKEPFVVPLAIPLVSGPCLLATIMLFAHMIPSYTLMGSAILIAWGISSFLLIFGDIIHERLGRGGLTVCERMTGMILVLLSVQRFLEGVELFFAS